MSFPATWSLTNVGYANLGRVSDHLKGVRPLRGSKGSDWVLKGEESIPWGCRYGKLRGLEQFGCEIAALGRSLRVP